MDHLTITVLQIPFSWIIMKPLQQLFYGTFIHCRGSRDNFHITSHMVVGVDEAGKIALVETGVSRDRVKVLEKLHGAKLVELNGWQFFMPGFVDTHVHAPQYSYTGTASDFELLKWLSTYTFPEEAKFEDLTYAANVYERCVTRLLNNGTTCAAYFATLHTEASKLLMDIMQEKGQRGWVGKVCMDINSPEYYCESAEAAVNGTEDCINHAKGLDLVEACITPRFAPSCSESTLKELGNLAKKYPGVAVQSHISENKKECEWVAEIFPEAQNYADVYDQAGLLTARTVMAHGIHLSRSEQALFKKRGVGVSHCPTSNFALMSGVLNARQLLQQDIKVGLGTDCAGGYSTSILCTLRDAATSSKLAQMQHGSHFLTMEELFFLATLGGAECMGLGERIGSFEMGKDWDALLVDVEPNLDIFSGVDDWRTVLEKFLYMGDDRCIPNVWVKGRMVK